jgi:protoporphyrinogen/coproporphyrinogen III oxidase
MAGLSAAWRARSLSNDVEITVVDKERVLGGKIRTETCDGFLLESGADGFLSRKSAGTELCTELGILDLLRGQAVRGNRSFVRRSHKLYPLPEGFSGLVPANMEALLETPLLSEEGKRRAMQEPSIPARLDVADEAVSHFMIRRFGKEAFDALIEPLLAGIYAGNADGLSLNATFPSLRELELRHGSVLAGLPAPMPSRLPAFVTFAEGMAELPRRVSCALGGVEMLTATAARAITRGLRVWRVELSKGDVLEADAVIITVPSAAAAALLSDVDQELGEVLAGIPSASTAVIHLGFEQKEVSHNLDGYGYVIPRVEGSEILACTWTSSKWGDRAPPGKVLLRLYVGRSGGPDPLARSDAELTDTALDELRLTMGIVNQPILVRIFRWRNAMPQYTLDHISRLEVIDARCADLEGIYLAGASYRGVGIPDCIESGFAAAQAATEYMNEHKQV